MPVYVDNMRASYGRMIMCHMLADTDEELHAMAAHIGVARRWHQKAGTYHSHYDICLAKRAITIRAGAIEIYRRVLAQIIRTNSINPQSESSLKKKRKKEDYGKM